MRERATSMARRNGGAGLAASAALHLVAFALLGLALRYAPAFSIAPTIEVSLVRLPSSTAPQKPPPPQPPARPATASQAPRLMPHVPPATLPAPPVTELTPPAAPAPPGAEALRRGLRLTLGCAHPEDFDLTPAEKDACRRMTTRTHESAPGYGALSEHIRSGVQRDEAERAYRTSTSMHDYPGVHCALNEACTPDPPTPPPEPGKEDCPWAWCNMVGR